MITLKLPLRLENAPLNRFFFDRLSDSLVNHILQITIQESSKLLSDAANLNKNNFEEMLSSLPVSTHTGLQQFSPCSHTHVYCKYTFY